MSRTLRIRPTGAVAVAGALLGAFALAGCSAGQVAQTSSQVAAVGGIGADAGQIAVRNAQIEFGEDVEGGSVYSRGDSAPLRMSIVNVGADADRLVSASSPVASSVQVTGDSEIPGGQVLAVEGEPPAVAPPTLAATGTPTAESGTSRESDATATTPPAAPPAAAPTRALTGEPEGHIVLTGLREDITAGRNYPLVLVFERAGEVRLDVPVSNPDEPRTAEHDEHGEDEHGE